MAVGEVDQSFADPHLGVAIEELLVPCRDDRLLGEAALEAVLGCIEDRPFRRGGRDAVDVVDLTRVEVLDPDAIAVPTSLAWTVRRRNTYMDLQNRTETVRFWVPSATAGTTPLFADRGPRQTGIKRTETNRTTRTGCTQDDLFGDGAQPRRSSDTPAPGRMEP